MVFLKNGAVQAREFNRGAAARSRAINLHRPRSALRGVEQGLAVGRKLRIVELTGSADDRARASSGGRYHLEHAAPAVFHAENQAG